MLLVFGHYVHIKDTCIYLLKDFFGIFNENYTGKNIIKQFELIVIIPFVKLL